MIFIDISRLFARYKKGFLPTGVDRVCLAYIAHFQARSCARAVLSDGRYNAVLSNIDSAKAFEALLTQTPSASGFFKKIEFKARLFGWMRAWRPNNRAVLINVGHAGLEHRSYSMPLRMHGAKLVLMVHDLIPITHPEFVRKGDDIQHQARMRHALKMASGIITNSQHTLDALSAFAQQHHYAMPPTVVAPLAHGFSSQAVAQQAPYANPYFVMLGTIEPRKNHWMLLQLWQRMIAEMGEDTPKLVIIGRRGWECDHVIDLLDRCQALKGHIIELSECTDNALASILHHANALLFPTLTEGFGLPVLEALQLNVPVIASDLAVFKEFAHDVPEYVDPLDSATWHNTIVQYCDKQHPKRLAQIARLQTIILPTWEKHFEIVDAFITQLENGE